MPDRLKPSRLEVRLEAEISSAPSVLEADLKRAELAAYRARLGRTEEVRGTLNELHQRYDSRPHVAVSSWLHLVEGLVGHFGDMDPSARDKILRAHALSSAAGLTPMRALSAAWLAHLDYAQLNMESTNVHVRLSLALSSPEQDSVRSRAGLVVAQCLHLAGRYDLAKPWYARVRSHARNEGDDATLGAVLHNMAWLHMSSARQTLFADSVGLTTGANIMISAESTKNFDELFGVSTLVGLEPILRAQVLSLQGQWAEALELYDRHFSCTMSGGFSRLRANTLADQAWCRLQSGDRIRAAEDAASAVQSLNGTTQIDDRAATHSRLGQIFEALQNVEETALHRTLAMNSWRSFLELQDKTVHLFGNVCIVE